MLQDIVCTVRITLHSYVQVLTTLGGRYLNISEETIQKEVLFPNLQQPLAFKDMLELCSYSLFMCTPHGRRTLSLRTWFHQLLYASEDSLLNSEYGTLQEGERQKLEEWIEVLNDGGANVVSTSIFWHAVSHQLIMWPGTLL